MCISNVLRHSKSINGVQIIGNSGLRKRKSSKSESDKCDYSIEKVKNFEDLKFESALESENISEYPGRESDFSKKKQLNIIKYFSEDETNSSLESRPFDKTLVSDINNASKFDFHIDSKESEETVDINQNLIDHTVETIFEELSFEELPNTLKDNTMKKFRKSNSLRQLKRRESVQDNDLNKNNMQRSYSIANFETSQKFRTASMTVIDAPLCEITTQELNVMVHPTKKEPSKISKLQIKEYSKKYKNIKDTKKGKVPWYKNFFEQIQAAHLITILAIVLLAFRLFPDSRRSSSEASTMTRLLYVMSFAAIFGSQFWMTFVSGLALFFNVPRHVFAQVQSVLFPLYFMLNAILSLVVIITFTQLYPTHSWKTIQLVQGTSLIFCFVINLVIRLYLAPVLTKLITIKMAIESEAKMGQEVGTNHPGVLSKCPHYMKLYKSFRKVHICIAIGNMAAMSATTFHLYYLATKLC